MELNLILEIIPILTIIIFILLIFYMFTRNRDGLKLEYLTIEELEHIKEYRKHKK